MISLCGFVPFYGEDEDEVYDKIEEAEYSFPSPYWDMISDDAKDFISKCFVLDKTHRLDIEQAFAHPWIQVMIIQTFKYLVFLLLIIFGIIGI